LFGAREGGESGIEITHIKVEIESVKVTRYCYYYSVIVVVIVVVS